MSFFGKKSQQPASGRFKAAPGSRYYVREHFLSPAEQAFFRTLKVVVGTRFTILAKVRLADIFEVEDQAHNIDALKSIADKQVDFLLTDPQSLEPVLGLELDEATSVFFDEGLRDEFIEAVFRGAGMPLLGVPVQLKYDPRKMAQQVIAKMTKEGIEFKSKPPGTPFIDE